MNFKHELLAIALISGMALGACSNTAAGVEEDAANAADQAGTAADRAAETGRDAAADVRDATRDAGRAAAAAIETIDVKTALMTDRTVDASHINVDTFHETKTVVLKGSVKTTAQRDEAARIAAAEAPDYRIDNQLTVVPNP
jgi:predicted small secreted protein